MDEELNEGDKVEGIVESLTPIGAKIRFDINKKGLLFKNEIFRSIRIGEKLELYIKKIHEDGKIDLTLEKLGYKNFIDDYSKKILSELEKSRGFLPYNDKSTPEAIKLKFQMSKKRFKESIGKLYRERRIELVHNGIKLA